MADLIQVLEGLDPGLDYGARGTENPLLMGRFSPVPAAFAHYHPWPAALSAEARRPVARIPSLPSARGLNVNAARTFAATPAPTLRSLAADDLPTTTSNTDTNTWGWLGVSAAAVGVGLLIWMLDEDDDDARPARRRRARR